MDEEELAYWLAERITSITMRREGEPVDVCRFHRELAEELLEELEGGR